MRKRRETNALPGIALALSVNRKLISQSQISSAERKKIREKKMNPEENPSVCLGVITKKRMDKLALLKKAIAEGTYKIKAEDIAEKILKKRLFELALTSYNCKYQTCRDN